MSNNFSNVPPENFTETKVDFGAYVFMPFAVTEGLTKLLCEQKINLEQDKDGCNNKLDNQCINSFLNKIYTSTQLGNTSTQITVHKVEDDPQWSILFDYSINVFMICKKPISKDHKSNYTHSASFNFNSKELSFTDNQPEKTLLNPLATKGSSSFEVDDIDDSTWEKLKNAFSETLETIFKRNFNNRLVKKCEAELKYFDIKSNVMTESKKYCTFVTADFTTVMFETGISRQELQKSLLEALKDKYDNYLRNPEDKAYIVSENVPNTRADTIDYIIGPKHQIILSDKRHDKICPQKTHIAFYLSAVSASIQMSRTFIETNTKKILEQKYTKLDNRDRIMIGFVRDRVKSLEFLNSSYRVSFHGNKSIYDACEKHLQFNETIEILVNSFDSMSDYLNLCDASKRIKAGESQNYILLALSSLQLLGIITAISTLILGSDSCVSTHGLNAWHVMLLIFAASLLLFIAFVVIGTVKRRNK